MTRVLGQPGSTQRKSRVLLLLGALAALVMAISLPAAAKYVSASATCATPNVLSGSNFEVDTNANFKVDGSSPCIDWLAGGTGSALRSDVFSKNDKGSGSGDDSFGQGTSEDDANPTIVSGSIPPNKSDLKVFGVHTETASGKFLQLFWTRINSPSGTTNMDFELNQKFCDPTAQTTNCASNGSGVTPETPVRTTGDKLITYDLSKGGTVPTISIRTWGTSSWGPATVISGGANAQALGSVNTSTIGSTDSGGIGAQDPFTFGEASISFNALFPQGSGCTTLGSAYLKSRSSDSFTAELKDFIGPEQVKISNCTTISTTLSASSITVGGSAFDSATLSGATTDAGGTVTYTVYSDSSCTQSVASGGTKTVTNGVVPNSSSVTFNSTGTFYWQASYSGDLNNSAAKSDCTSEILSVVKAKPSISTSLSSSAIIVGSSVSDSATLSGATTDAGGTVTYTVYSDNTCSTSVADGGTKTVTAGSVPDSSSVTFNSTGTFYWQASYSGDSKNEAAKSVCTSEVVAVTKKQPSISTTLSATTVTVGGSVSDSATLSNATSDAGGTVTYTVYSDSGCSTSVADGGTKTVTGGSVPDSSSVTFNSPGTFYWQASYSGDAKNEAAKSVCTSEQVVVNKAPSNISTTQRVRPQDSVTISASAGGTPTGNVTFELYAPGDTSCSGTVKYSETVALNGAGSASTSNNTFDVVAATAGTYRWKVTYGGDATHTGVTSDCGTEQFTITITNS